jgi:hypothetical protein
MTWDMVKNVKFDIYDLRSDQERCIWHEWHEVGSRKSFLTWMKWYLVENVKLDMNYISFGQKSCNWHEWHKWHKWHKWHDRHDIWSRFWNLTWIAWDSVTSIIFYMNYMSFCRECQIGWPFVMDAGKCWKIRNGQNKKEERWRRRRRYVALWPEA